jgi:phage shock protein PspC (stress-responsive transcriptional regulator)
LGYWDVSGGVAFRRMASTALVRPRRGRIVGGVCAAVARRFDLSPTLVRVLFVLSMLLPGPQILAYLVLWIVVPSED